MYITPLFFYYVDNSLLSVAKTTVFQSGEPNQELIYSFSNDSSHIKTILLKDTDIIYPIECIHSSDISLTCNYDMSYYYGYRYKISFISECEDKE